MSADRSLRLAGAPNARELGGLPTADGRRIRSGVVVRAGALGRLTDPDLPAVARLKLACRIDLRHASEIAHAPPEQLPPPGPRVVPLPVYDQAHPVFTYVSALLLGHDVSSYQQLVEGGSPAAMESIYRWFVSGDSARAGFASALRLLAEAANLPAVFHCSAGKDRTGWLTVALLTALGVDRSIIRTDYLRTNLDTSAARQEVLELLGRRPGVDLAAVEPILQARAEYLDAAYDEVDRRYGSFEEYLRIGLGVDDGVLAGLRRNLLV